jgi:eukaryotic-like serine/threonine-protein kinase
MTVETDVIAGRFELTGPPLKGGMGVLYRARDRRITNRVVAIKMLLDGANDADLRRRFEQEASAAGGLNHENIVRVFDVGEHQGIPFIVMEFVDGETLASLIARRETIDLARALGWCDSLCDGLSYAHHAGIVHRDIKPANLMIERRRGTLKILDFGIARIRRGATVGGTLTGTMIGTLNYMSPEQARGDPSVDHRSDIFSVGSVIFELLSHRQAFPGQEPYAVMHRIQHEAVAPLSHVRPGVPVALERLVARALEKDATRRFQRLEEMGRGCARHSSVAGRRRRPPPSRRERRVTPRAAC